MEDRKTEMENVDSDDQIDSVVVHTGIYDIKSTDPNVASKDVVKPRQEYEWRAKHFLPPKHYAPELYLLEATPELRDALAISESSSQLSPVSGPRGSPGARSYRDGYRYTYRQGYPDNASSPRSPSPQRKGAGSKTYRGANGYEREAAYTNNTNEDSGVAGMSPDNQYKYRDRENYYQADKRSRDHRHYDEDEEKRRQEERDRWANDQDERRRREEADRERQRREEEELERQRREEEEQERQRREDEENRQREEERRRAEEDEEEQRRRREEEDRRREEEDRRRANEKRRRDEEDKDERLEEERRREEEDRRRREEEEERRRREEEDRLKGGSVEEENRYSSPHSPSADVVDQRDTESARQRRKEEQRKLLEELQEARDSRQRTEKDREELVKKAKTLQSKTQNRRNLARDIWKKRYFEEKKKTPPLEDQTSRLRDELDALHRKMMAVLEGPKDKNARGGDSRPSQKNNYVIQCTRLQHDIDDLKRRVENAKMKLTAEMKLRTQAAAEVRVMREELTREKIKLSQSRSQQFAALSPWYGSTPVPSIPGSRADVESVASHLEQQNL